MNTVRHILWNIVALFGILNVIYVSKHTLELFRSRNYIANIFLPCLLWHFAACVNGIACLKVMQVHMLRLSWDVTNVHQKIIIISWSSPDSYREISFEYIRLLKVEPSRPPFSKVKLSFYILQAEVKGQGKLQNTSLTLDLYLSLKCLSLRRQHEFYIMTESRSFKKKKKNPHYFSHCWFSRQWVFL